SSRLLSYRAADPQLLHSFPTRRSSDLSHSKRSGSNCKPWGPAVETWDARAAWGRSRLPDGTVLWHGRETGPQRVLARRAREGIRSEEHTSELQSLRHLVCRLLLEKKNK